jgi:WD40 repeat protein
MRRLLLLTVALSLGCVKTVADRPQAAGPAPVLGQPAEGKPEDPDDGEAPQLVLDTGGHTAPIFQAVFAPGGDELITVSLDKTIRFWDVNSGRSLRVLRPPLGPGHQGELHAVALSPDGRTLAVAGFGFLTDGKRSSPIFLIDRASGTITRTLRAHTGTVQALAFSADGKRLASGGVDRLIRVWDVAGGQVIKKLPGHTAPVTGLALSPDGKKLVSAGSPPHVGRMDGERVAWLWSVEDEQVLNRLEGEHTRPVQRVAWSPDGTRIATGSQAEMGDSFVALWDADGKPVRRIDYHRQRRMGCASLAFTPDSRHLLVSLRDAFYSSAGIYPLDGGEPRQLFFGNYHLQDIPSGAGVVSGDGRRVAVINDRHHRTALYDTAEGRLVRVLGGVGRQPALVSWVRQPGQRLIAWRNQAPGQGYKAWEPMTEELFEHAFRLDELEMVPAPPGKDNRYVRTHYAEGPLLLWGAGGPDVLLKQGEKELARLKPPGDSWTTAAAVSFLTADRGVLTNHTGLYVFDTSPLGAGRDRLLYALSGPNGPVLSVSPSPDNGRYLLAASDDQVIRVWDPKHPQPLLSLFVAGRDWVAWTPEGYYAASPGGEKLVGWVTDNGPDQMMTSHPAQRFHQRLYRPNLIKALLDKGSKLLPPRAGLQVVDDKALPKVKLKATAEAAAKGQPVVSLRLLVDGRPLPDGAGLLDLKEPKDNAEAEWEVTLPPGEHELKVLAHSPDTAAASAAVRVNVKPPADVPAKAGPTLHLLAVGINQYQNKDLCLRCAAQDAESLAGAFRKHCVGPGNVFGAVRGGEPLLNARATRAGVLEALGALRRGVKPADLAVVYFAGHGVKDGDDFYLLTVEADTTRLPQTAVSGKELRKQLTDLPCQVLLILDACHSAAGVRAFRPAADDAARSLTDDDCAVAVLCAAMGTEYAEEKKEHGLFTRALVEALERTRGVPYNQHDHRQYVHHLHAYVLEEVQAASDDRQHPFLALPWVTQPFAVRLLPQGPAGGP